jgi:hypothetical protein
MITRTGNKSGSFYALLCWVKSCLCVEKIVLSFKRLFILISYNALCSFSSKLLLRYICFRIELSYCWHNVKTKTLKKSVKTSWILQLNTQIRFQM